MGIKLNCLCKIMSPKRKLIALLMMFLILHAFIVFEDYSWRSSLNRTHSSPTTSPLTEVDEDDDINNRTYFFVETSNSTSFTAREACAIESVALLHPNNSVQILHMAEDFNYSHPLSKILTNFSNVVIRQTDLDDLLKDSPMEPWIETRPWTKSPYNVSHLSDILRSLLMWKYGGVYLDMDIVALKSLNDLRNTIGLQSEDYLAAGVLIFHKGHPLMDACVHELAQNYRPWSWGDNGPGLYTRMLKKMCHVTHLKELQDKKKCLGVTVMSPSAFYPIFYTYWRRYFQAKDAAETILYWLGSYTIHVWNKLAEKEALKIGSGQPYDLAAKNFCPKTYDYMKPFKIM